MSLDFISSYAFGQPVGIEIPDEANCLAIKRGRCIFAKSENPEDHKYERIPYGAKTVSFPDRREHGNRYIFYGRRVFS